MNLFSSHTARISTSGKVLLRRDDNGHTIIQVPGATPCPTPDPRPAEEVAADLRSQGLEVTIW